MAYSFVILFLMKKKLVIGAGLTLLVILLGIFLWKSTHHVMQRNTSSSSKPKPLPKEITVSLSKEGFSPQTVTIKVGGAVRWKNESGQQQTVNSDNYPTNQLHKELNFGIFGNGSSVVHTFTKLGIYGYHNQFHHEQKGKVIVTQ